MPEKKGNARDSEAMMAGYLCGDCEGALFRLGATRKQVDAIKRILHYVHAMATGHKEHVNWDEAFVVMRFQEGSEQQRAFEQGIRPGLEAVGIKATRGDDLVQSRPVFEKVFEQMKRARFIIAQVDAKRMNIFYELGFAMGKQAKTCSSFHLRKGSICLPTSRTWSA